MPSQCFAPSASGIRSRVSSAFGHIVEWFVKQEYCSAKGGCREFVLGGTGIDFFDENSTTTRCRFLAAYLATHNTIDQDFVSSSCEIRKRPVDPDDDENERFAVPDIITHDPGTRMEFYELKANSAAGKLAGQIKIAAFQAMIDFFKQTDPNIGYGAGTLFDPDRSIVIWDGTWLGSPVKATLHFFRTSDGLIVYEVCVEISGQLLAEVFVKAIIKLAVLCVILLLAPMVAGGALAIAWNSPFGGAIGPDQKNNRPDVLYAQALLNDWRAYNGRDLIAVGDFDESTTNAISDFQSSNGLADSGGQIAPGDETIAALERSHFDNATSPAVTSTGLQDLTTGNFNDFVFKDDPDGIDPDIDQEPDLLVALGAEASEYLKTVYDNLDG